ncbi:hypothetical protein HPB52_004858 [Rhipicephalus sanguineus]|uniref:Cytochrome P450 n=1 Tax=Rhipicephalus sanguineus TaxID=34632 RepID=A0A9D4PU89_RHISA|nr:hypothetical protein HPB52_004858 [Rhipicephalus sanguineus]
MHTHCRTLPGNGRLGEGSGKVLLTDDEVCKPYSLGRWTFPLPHLNRPQAITLRMRQPETTYRTFLDENKEHVVPFSFLPFGEGPRQCVGMKFASMNVKLGLFHALSRFSFETCSETQVVMTVKCTELKPDRVELFIV